MVGIQVGLVAGDVRRVGDAEQAAGLDVQHSVGTLEAHYRFMPDRQVCPYVFGSLGGTDVRANTTRAERTGGGFFRLSGHKWFMSAPMSDAFLVLAQTRGGLSCFLLPRWRPDGSKNPLQVLRLKRKMGNVSNASSETELRGALAWMVGEEGRGVRTIIEMVNLTRLDCAIASARRIDGPLTSDPPRLYW